MNTRHAGICCLFLMAAAAVTLPAADRGTRAIIHLTNGNTIQGEAWVIKWTFDHIIWTMKQGGQAQTRMDTEKVAKVEWLPLNPDYRAGDAKLKAGDHAAAASYFNKVVHSPAPAGTAIQALLKLAESLKELEQFDKAVGVLGQINKNFDDWVHVKDVLYLQGRYLLAAGKVGPARARFQQLAKDAVDYKSFRKEAAALAKLGLSACLREEGEHKRAAALLSEALQAEELTADPVTYAEMLRSLLVDYRAIEDHAKVIETYKEIRYQPIPDAFRAEAFLALAKDAYGAGRRIQAFDWTCTAAVIGRVSSSQIHVAARDLAKKIAEELVQDPQLSDDDKREYMRYVSNL